jgi:hypothetical protein
MGKEDEIKKLLAARKESKNVEYKGPKSWGEMTKDERHGIIKDILGMSNTRDGGRLIFGVRDGDCEFVGVPNDKLGGFDPTDINNVLVNFTEPKHYCAVHKSNIEGRWVVLIEVPEFKNEPIICKKNHHSEKHPGKVILREGAIYVRNEKPETVEVNAVEDMRDLLGRALRKLRDRLLGEITTILEGKPITPTETDEEIYGKEILIAGGNIAKKIGDNFGYWEVYAYPLPYIKNRVADKERLKELVNKFAVHSRGWSFPFIREPETSYFDEGWQGYTSKDVNWHKDVIGIREGFRVYKNGLFVWRGIISADAKQLQTGEGEKVIIYTDTIFAVTDYLKFFKRFFEDFESDTSIRIHVSMDGIADRVLTDYDPLIGFWAYPCISTENRALSEAEVTVAELNSSYQDIANNIIRELLLYFNADRITPETIKSWQDKYLSGAY